MVAQCKAHVFVTYHCCRRVELQWPIRLDDGLEQLLFTICSLAVPADGCAKGGEVQNVMEMREESFVGC